jgi:hypothetical protein
MLKAPQHEGLQGWWRSCSMHVNFDTQGDKGAGIAKLLLKRAMGGRLVFDSRLDKQIFPYSTNITLARPPIDLLSNRYRGIFPRR